MTDGSSLPATHRGRHQRLSRVLVVLVLAVVLVSVSGCTPSGTAVSTPFATSPPVLEHGPTDEVKVGTIPGLGPVLVDGQGITLYMYETDHQGSPSRCYGICAIQWPPLLLPAGAAAPIAGPGIQARLLGTAPRSDGTTQITYNGWPLYTWPPDRSPGKATGQALTNAGGIWFVVDPAGNAVRTALSA
jgi:predicted lipoprotein with Yx(FWY)xxD motif